MTEALAQGGTSFDALYVNVNGSSGYFDRSLNVYGQEGRPCPRCGTPVRRDEFMNRSSYTLPALPAAPAQRPLLGRAARRSSARRRTGTRRRFSRDQLARAERPAARGVRA